MVQTSIHLEKGNLRNAGKKLKELLEPIVVKITLGGRSMAGIEKKNFQKYVKRSLKLGYSSVKDRLMKNDLFRS